VIALLQTLHTNTKQRLRVAYMNYNFLGTPARAKKMNNGSPAWTAADSITIDKDLQFSQHSSKPLC